MKRFAGWAAALLALAAVAAGCGNRGGSVAGYVPEGHPAGALAIQVDTTGGQVFTSALVFMQAPTNRVRLFDDANSQGYVPVDGVLEPVRVFTTGWGLYRTDLPNIDLIVPHWFLARGSRDGEDNALSPVTNVAFLPGGGAAFLVPPRDTIPLAPRAPRINPDAVPSVHVDSLYFHVGVVSTAQKVILEIVKGPVTQYLVVFERQPDNSFARTVVYEDLPPALGQTYFWHVDEYDANERLIAATSATGGFVITAPKVFGSPFEWPTASNHLIFQPWTIPGFIALRQPGG